MYPTAFDTLAYANELKNLGIEPKLAEAQAELQAKVFETYSKNDTGINKDTIHELTKEFTEIKNEIKAEFTILENKINKEIISFKNDFKTEIHNELDVAAEYIREEHKSALNSLKEEIKSDLNSLRSEIKSDISELRTETNEFRSSIKEIKTSLFIKISGTIVGCFTILGALFAVFSRFR